MVVKEFKSTKLIKEEWIRTEQHWILNRIIYKNFLVNRNKLKKSLIDKIDYNLIKYWVIVIYRNLCSLQGSHYKNLNKFNNRENILLEFKSVHNLSGCFLCTHYYHMEGPIWWYQRKKILFHYLLKEKETLLNIISNEIKKKNYNTSIIKVSKMNFIFNILFINYVRKVFNLKYFLFNYLYFLDKH
ncbi:hypothetical protein (nucleomorph) [Guillardia theta]|uniref:Uncharacterized protein n=1 Tax=Guillardia theta TaxID=55529 RepID=Q98S06_GUITH|nr:hypothetical protein GTHECHR3128 [Guillardia theta]AAK39772.1 hypothetical protein [Guillardia theta]